MSDLIRDERNEFEEQVCYLVAALKQMLLEYDTWCRDIATRDIPSIFTLLTLEAARDAVKRVPEDAWDKATERILRERAEVWKKLAEK